MLDARVEKLEGNLTPAERTLWAYINANLENIAFENGATLAQKSGVSPNTVSRFCRRLGYKGLKGLKEDLRDEVRVKSLLNTTLLARVEQQNDDLTVHLNNEIEALVKFWEQIGSQHWQDIVQCVSQAEHVFVCGFQTIRGLTEDFANRLSLVRANVEFLDLYGGVLGGWIDSYDKQCCVLLIDIAPYADAGIAFANECIREKADLVVFTDEYGIAKYMNTPHIVTITTKTGLILESTAGLVNALNVLLHCVAGRNRDKLKQRLERFESRVKRLNLYRT
ncbi:RpiR family transcriptional regulator [Brenneria goodwinii]|uniref:RpiR family transcriptional regulator n=2 Tax=Brenneria goodwinii TaxID=1109412 RepID=A0A0G4K2Z7_9GAMM|nr:MurR/RpiR family transcriptional regulator [Brenneria goodwinii]ATA24681.1 RpiR family transcriptional regulator [Brenneria goodwinii]MCG8158750.1 MurR/RpiR family transcriptional regulator [Brenneria goodwinii]MCG8163235.1 MurR/RpiR family transcriptional regulator [Brenneria goodwinii]MCG8167656.1 MurR/RpiR family transcriptional regulator [Brenneria goodwinii]MCG8170562.1 MurR/RpiR family transcriptional regulator [Brenneria goodwinii]